MSTRTKSGFTLIEMLVVIAVIGILSAAVLTGLGPARTKAKDARIVSALQQVRIVAESLYDGATGTYPAAADMLSDPNIGKASTEITTNGGIDFNITNAADNKSFAAFATLNSSAIYCADSAGTAKEVPSAPTAGSCE